MLQNGPEISCSGGNPNPCRYLDFPIGSPYTGPAFKLSVRRSAGAVRRGSAGRRRLPAVSGRLLRPSFPLHSLSKAHEMISGVRSSEDTGMPTGTIARLLIDKGFGFIRDEGGIEHFFHRSSVRGAVFELLREGQRVEFTAGGVRQGTSRRRSPAHRKLTPTPRTPGRRGIAPPDRDPHRLTIGHAEP